MLVSESSLWVDATVAAAHDTCFALPAVPGRGDEEEGADALLAETGVVAIAVVVEVSVICCFKSVTDFCKSSIDSTMRSRSFDCFMLKSTKFSVPMGSVSRVDVDTDTDCSVVDVDDDTE